MKIIVLLSLFMLVACGSETDTSDLEVFVAETAAKPRGRIPPMPEFTPYSAFVYGASALRSPFKSPVVFEEMANRFATLVDAPDESRSKEALENYTLGELTLVGTLSKAQNDELKALIQTSTGNVHVVQVGQYMGKNHGKIMSVTDTQLDLIEVVPNGSGGWITRPHSMGLKESAEGDK